MTKLKVQNFYHYKIKSAKIFTVSLVKVQKYLHQSHSKLS